MMLRYKTLLEIFTLHKNMKISVSLSAESLFSASNQGSTVIMCCPACLSKLLGETCMKLTIDSGLIKTGGTLLHATPAASLIG